MKAGNTLSDRAVRRVCQGDRERQFHVVEPAEQTATRSRQPGLHRFVVCDKDGSVDPTVPDDFALKPGGSGWVKPLVFADTPDGECWIPQDDGSATEVFEVRGITLAVPGDFISLIQAPNGRLETYFQQNTRGVEAKYTGASDLYEVMRAGVGTEVYLEAAVPAQPPAGYPVVMDFIPVFDHDDCSNVGSWEPRFLHDVLCRPVGDITAGGSGSVTVYKSFSPPVSAGVTLDGVVLDWMHGGTQISDGKACIARRMVDVDLGAVWRFVHSECE